MTSSVVKCINRRYCNIDDDDDSNPAEPGGGGGGFLFMSCSPESKKGLVPNIISLNNYNINVFGGVESGSGCGLQLKHITDLDLTDNLVSDWSQVFIVLKEFPCLEFLNLTNNLLTDTVSKEHCPDVQQGASRVRKFILNGNKLNWPSVHFLLSVLTRLEELHLSINNLHDIDDAKYEHSELRMLYLSCNPISDLAKLQDRFVFNCPKLEGLILAECPISRIPRLEKPEVNTLKQFNISCSEINSWQELDNINSYQGLTELKIQDCPLLRGYTEDERRMLLISRLPHVKILNGGDTIKADEREDAERAFIRYFLYSENVDEDDRPARLDELIAIHGRLEPLANIDMSPEISVSVTIKFKDNVKQEQISVRQTVKSFKKRIEQLYNISSCSMRVFYYDQEMSKLTGPEEMKYGSKGLYTYNIRDGDYFEVDMKPKQRKPSGSSTTASPQKFKKN
eukprot:TRINITY_DN21524_c0_g1_i2.p1 TRINITY_DN21524_c0_g1~~TRINITY_DN21524_c0_g1_i2.p1  ORF type:complete len:453 (+),score=95.33 TRINITY_DN21524_c0_g1_i2:147-1505(+)